MERCMRKRYMISSGRRDRRSSHLPHLPLARWTVAHVCCCESSKPIARLDRNGRAGNKVEHARGARLWTSHLGESFTVHKRRSRHTSQKVMVHRLFHELCRRATAAIPGKMTELSAFETRALAFFSHWFPALPGHVAFLATVHARHVLFATRRWTWGDSTGSESSATLRQAREVGACQPSRPTSARRKPAARRKLLNKSEYLGVADGVAHVHS